MHPEMASTEPQDFPPQGGSVIAHVPWSDLPISSLTGLSYDPALIQQYGGQSNHALLRLMKYIQECIN